MPWSRSAATIRSRPRTSSRCFRTTCRPKSGGSRWSTFPRPSTTTTGASISRSATSRRSRPWPSEIRNLLADAEATRALLHRRVHGPERGWLAYGAAIAGEASLVLSVEDIDEKLSTEETLTDPKTGVTSTRKIMNIDKLVDVIVKAMLAREADGKEFGVIVLAEGLAQFLRLVVPGRRQVRRARPHLAGLRPTWRGRWSRRSRRNTRSGPARSGG